jgi:hypothetical protein
VGRAAVQKQTEQSQQGSSWSCQLSLQVNTEKEEKRPAKVDRKED